MGTNETTIEITAERAAFLEEHALGISSNHEGVFSCTAFHVPAGETVDRDGWHGSNAKGWHLARRIDVYCDRLGTWFWGEAEGGRGKVYEVPSARAAFKAAAERITAYRKGWPEYEWQPTRARHARVLSAA